MVKKLVAAVVFILLAACALAFAQRPENIPASPAAAKTPEGQVVLDGKTLFTIRVRALSFAPADRAQAVSNRLTRIVGDPRLSIDSITWVDSETTTDVVAGDMVLMTVTDGDAIAEGKSRKELADDLARKIRNAITAHNREYSMDSLLLGGLYAFAATVALIGLIVLINRAFPKSVAKLESWRGVRIRSIRFQSIEILHEDRIVAFLIGVATGVRLLVIVGLLYLYIPLVFSFFPWTRGYASRIFEYVLTPIEKIAHGVFGYLPNVFFIAVILVFTHFVIKFIRLFFTEVERRTITIPGFYTDWAEPTFKIVRFLIIAFATVVAFPYFPGSDSPAFKGVSVFLGILLSLGSTSAVANVVAGVILTYMRAFTLGDRVKIAETVGDVVEKNLLVTRIRTIKNVDITIPNSMVLGSHITNYSSSAQSYGLILHTSVTIGYDAPWRTVHRLLIEAAKATEYILELPEPFVFQTSLDDFYVTYELNAYTDKPLKMASIYSELHQHIQDGFNEAGVEIMSPHYSQIRDGNSSTIPEAYLPAGYVPNAIRIVQTDGSAGPVARNNGRKVRDEPPLFTGPES